MTYTHASPNPLKSFALRTKSNSTTYDPPLVLLRCEEAGAVTLKNIDGTSVLLTVLAGEYVPGPITAIMSTGTTGTLFCGWKNE